MLEKYVKRVAIGGSRKVVYEPYSMGSIQWRVHVLRIVPSVDRSDPTTRHEAPRVVRPPDSMPDREYESILNKSCTM